MLKKILPVIIITVCLLFAGCKAPADQEQKNNTETAVLSTETQEEDWKQVHSTQKETFVYIFVSGFRSTSFQ